MFTNDERGSSVGMSVNWLNVPAMSRREWMDLVLLDMYIEMSCLRSFDR